MSRLFALPLRVPARQISDRDRWLDSCLVRSSNRDAFEGVNHCFEPRFRASHLGAHRLVVQPQYLASALFGFCPLRVFPKIDRIWVSSRDRSELSKAYFVLLLLAGQRLAWLCRRYLRHRPLWDEIPQRRCFRNLL